MSVATAQRVNILLVEDNLPYRELLQRRLRALSFPYALSTVGDGEAALAFLRRQALYEGAPRPDLILLDVHLPQKSGWEVLAWLRATSGLATIPVVMLTGALSSQDEQGRARLQSACCVVKPATVEEYHELVKILEELMSAAVAPG